MQVDSLYRLWYLCRTAAATVLRLVNCFPENEMGEYFAKPAVADEHSRQMFYDGSGPFAIHSNSTPLTG